MDERMNHAKGAPMGSNAKLFEGEKLLVGVSVIGFLLALVCAVYVAMNGATVSPEGNVKSAFSFNAAIAMFTLCMAAFIPLSGLNPRKRARIRWGFVLTILIGYAIETIQHFRGIHPRFTKAGSVFDVMVGGFFGLISVALVILTVLFAVSFFTQKIRPLLNLGIRYAFGSTMLGFVAGMVMIALQSRYTGPSGNFIVLHGLGFHALQTLPLLGWLLERAKCGYERARTLIHIGSIAWLLSNLCIGLHTVRGESVFELTLWPIVALVALLVWLLVAVISVTEVFRHSFVKRDTAMDHS